jgi:hypothetical protein
MVFSRQVYLMSVTEVGPAWSGEAAQTSLPVANMLIATEGLGPQGERVEGWFAGGDRHGKGGGGGEDGGGED